MIKEIPTQDGRTYGIVTINPGLQNYKGQSAHRGMHGYQFGLHWESMSLINQMFQKENDKAHLIWPVLKREIHHWVDWAANRAKVQERYPRRLKRGGKIWPHTRVHPTTFRRYWIDRMWDAGVTNPYILEYQFGLQTSSITRRWAIVTEEDILEVTKKAAPFFEVLQNQQPEEEKESVS